MAAIRERNAARGFTAAQYEVINAMSCLHHSADLVALKNVLVQFLNTRLQSEIDGLYDDGTLTDEKMSALAGEHLRTPYRMSV